MYWFSRRTSRALNRIADETHPHIRFKKGDRIIFSSRMIPGNEVSINSLINKLVYKGVDVVFPKAKNIHVSGHPGQEELKMMYSDKTFCSNTSSWRSHSY